MGKEEKKELRHRIDRSQQELEYWRTRADQMRSVLDHLETDYLTHRTDCFLVRQRRLRDAVGRALVVVASLEGEGGWMPDVDAASSSSGCSSPSESSSLLSSPQPPPTVSAAAYSRNVRRLAIQSRLKSTLQLISVDCMY